MSLRLRLVLASSLMLFLELALIRWLGSNVLHLSYFSNIVLLGSFLGVGLGLLRAAPGRRPPHYFPVALAALVALVLLVPVTIDRSGSDLVFFSSLTATGPPVWVVLPVVFVCVAAVLAGPGELVGACFLQMGRLDAYRWDLVGSLAGIAGFTLLSYLRAPSAVWGLVVAVLTVVLLGPGWTRARLLAAVASAVVVGSLVLESLAPGVSWSPYYKVETVAQQYGGVDTSLVLVNGIPHQNVVPLASQGQNPRYTLPYERTDRTSPGDVLVVGAGNGIDVAQALARGATSVDAVEIDPRIQQIGRELNPDKPYADPRVQVRIDDGRAWLQRTDRTYDTILFALPDSLTLVAGASQIRLESYLFTAEALRAAHDRLRPGGVFAMYNGYREEWLVGRFANTVTEAFGHRPCVDAIWSRSNAVIVAAREPGRQRCDTPVEGATPLTDVSGPAPVTDARPFPYLRTPEVPPLYLATLLGVVLLSLVLVRAVGGPLRRMASYADLFLLGAAFLLLETRSITGFALLFGTTWVVNAVVFAGVLLAVLLAVEVTRRLPRLPSRPVAYGALAVSLAVAAAVPGTWLLSLPLGARLVVATAVAFLPIFTANVVFASRFAGTPDPTTAFAANLLGAMVGGCLEYLAIVIGYPALLVVAALLYLGAFLVGRGRATAPSVPTGQFVPS